MILHSTFFRLFLLAALLSLGGFYSAAERFDEYQVKSVFLLNFTRFVTWPDSAFDGPDAPLRLCVFGHDPFNGALEKTLRNETADGRDIMIKQAAQAADAGNCQIIFVSAQEQPRLPALLDHLGSRPALVVGESAGFCRQGGVIEFTWQQDTLGFAVNLLTARRLGLDISFKLLKLASEVVK